MTELIAASPWLFLLGVLLVGAGIWLRGHLSRRVVYVALLPVALLAMAALLTSAYGFWYTHRPLPGDTDQELFQGIHYTRDVRSEPRLLVIHVVTIVLNAPGIRFLVTPGQPTGGRQLPARTTSQFVAEFGVQLAVNGDFFQPWYSETPWNYYPHVGDPVDVIGFASSLGEVYSQGRPGQPTLYLSEDNRVSFEALLGAALYNAISGNVLFVEEGAIRYDRLTDAYHEEPHPRTALALDGDRRLLIIVVDGRQPNYSEGAAMTELGQIVLEYGGDTALNLDGGGSTTLVMLDEMGAPRVLNSPIDNRIPGRERPVANHLGILAQPLTR